MSDDRPGPLWAVVFAASLILVAALICAGIYTNLPTP